MPIAKVNTGSIVGLSPTLVTVEVNIVSRGFPSFNIVGLASKEVDESKLRIRSAIDNCNFEFPYKEKITVNLAPANIPKEGSLYDLPITIGILMAYNNQVSSQVGTKIFMGELSLDGSVKPVFGTAVIADLADGKNIKYMYVPKKNINELKYLNKKCFIKPVNNLKDLVLHLEGQKIISYKPKTNNTKELQPDILLEDIQEQEHAKRAIIIAAAGNHNIALSGPPGTGKSMIAKALKSILPRLTNKEAKEVLRIQSVNGTLAKKITRPFRSPHHTISRAGLIGGGSKIKPGEITLAHNGILFMDELNEFPRSVIESLRQPLEDRKVTISRAIGTLDFPSSFSLVVANNPCPCGYLNSNIRECTCRINDIKRYQKRVSGPIWDRIDIHITMKEFDVKKIKLSTKDNDYGEYTKKIKRKIERARKIQTLRYKNTTHKTNAEQSNKYILENGLLSKKGKQTLDSAVEKLGISPRGYFRVIKVGRTIADLEKSPLIKEKHILEALSYRRVEEIY